MKHKMRIINLIIASIIFIGVLLSLFFDTLFQKEYPFSTLTTTSYESITKMTSSSNYRSEKNMVENLTNLSSKDIRLQTNIDTDPTQLDPLNSSETTFVTTPATEKNDTNKSLTYVTTSEQTLKHESQTVINIWEGTEDTEEVSMRTETTSDKQKVTQENHEKTTVRNRGNQSTTLIATSMTTPFTTNSKQKTTFSMKPTETNEKQASESQTFKRITQLESTKNTSSHKNTETTSIETMKTTSSNTSKTETCSTSSSLVWIVDVPAWSEKQLMPVFTWVDTWFVKERLNEKTYRYYSELEAYEKYKELTKAGVLCSWGTGDQEEQFLREDEIIIEHPEIGHWE